MPNDCLTPDTYVRVLSSESYRPYACRAQALPELEAWQRSFRPRLRSLLGLDRIAARGRCNLQPRRLGQEELPDHVREEWTIVSEPGLELPFFVVRPLPSDASLPVLLTPHGHLRRGRHAYAGDWANEEERAAILRDEMDLALQAVREGYLAIAPDVRGFAGLRRREDLAGDILCSCRMMQMHALLFGRTLIGERVWDITRLIDYALTRPDVDRDRIAVMGNSGGGTVTIYAAACDERIAVAIPSAAFCTFEHSIGAIWHCECNYVPGLLADAEMADVAGLIAPRPFLAVTGREDPLFPYEGVRTAFTALQQTYEAAGAADRCRLFTGEGGHRHYAAGVWPFLRTMLA